MQNPFHAELEELFREIMRVDLSYRQNIRILFEGLRMENDTERL